MMKTLDRFWLHNERFNPVDAAYLCLIQRRDHNDLMKAFKLTRQIIYCLKGQLFERYRESIMRYLLTANENNINITVIEFLNEMQVIPISSIKYNKHYQQSWLR
jgi:hypothetical protein